MPASTLAELRRLRTWLWWVVAAAAFLQGGQYAARPSLPAHATQYRSLGLLGLTGWTLTGVLVMLFAVWIAVATAMAPRFAGPGFCFGSVLYLLLMAGSVLSGVVPGLLVLAAGVCLSEVWAYFRQQWRLQQPTRSER